MSKQTERLKHLPAVDKVLRHQLVVGQFGEYPRPQLVQWIREAIDHCRQQILDGAELDDDAMLEIITEHLRRRGRFESGERLQAVINATGVLLHTNLGRAPLAAAAIERAIQASGYTNVELNLATGKRSRRGDRATRLMAQLSGAEDAVVVNNCAGATILVLQAIAHGREVIVSRGQLVEIGGGFRLPDVFVSAGVKLREVGTTNRTYLHDYENAVSDQTGALIRVHRSNFSQSGFVTEPSIDELVAAKRPADVPVIDDLGSGCFQDLGRLGLREPTVTASVDAGADLVLFSGDKLFGGPQCGIVVGRRHWIEKLRGCPIMRAVRVDKLTLAALEATAEIHLAGDAEEQLPLMRMIFQPADAVRAVCHSVVEQIGEVKEARVEIVACESPIGGGTLPGATLDSYGIRISGCAIDRLAMQLRQQSPPIQGRVADDALLLDLRTVSESEVPLLIDMLRNALKTVSADA